MSEDLPMKTQCPTCEGYGIDPETRERCGTCEGRQYVSENELKDLRPELKEEV